ncbi:thermonuclease family protein, partial [bacterium]|nr:thermonuclease family protein [bacterium]
MLINKKVKNTLLLFLILILFLGIKAGAWDNIIVHPKLTRKATELYNNNFFNKKLGSEEINWIVEGAIAEDTDPRYLNHFYNPETGQGLSDGVFSGNSAKWWAYNQKSVSGDYSVPKILENYKEGNKKRAYQGVGHILHLIQDMSVPAHVRNDAHPEKDAFEEWTKQYNFIAEDKLSFIEVNNINNVFDELSKYTHYNFYSNKDIKENNIDINDLNVKIERDINGCLVEYAYKNDYKLIKIVGGIRDKNYLFDFKVHFDYWQQLYPKAIGYSAGAIDYFQKEFDKIDKNEEEENLSLWGKVKNSVAEKTFNLWDGARYVLGDKVLDRRKRVDNIYTASKKDFEKTKRGLVFYYDANKEIVLGVFDYSKEKSAEAMDWTSDRFYQAYDKMFAWDDESSNNGDKYSILDNPIVLSVQEEYKNNEDYFKEDIKILGDRLGFSGEIKEEENKEEIRFKFVYDGDTILLENGEKVRYIGIDTPELNKTGKEDDECLAWEARARNMELLSQGKVTLKKDPGADKDKYGRLLRYIYVG